MDHGLKETRMFKIQLLDHISSMGLSQFPASHYEVSDDIVNPDALLLRSHDLHHMIIPDSVKIIARAGVGVNNIPVEVLTQRGIPVLNTPGANANAVKELVIAGMLLACRNICHAWEYAHQLNVDNSSLSVEIETNKKKFIGYEIQGKTLGVIGLGNIGVKVSNAALQLGMRVIGYDPAISIKNAWELSSAVIQANHIEKLIAEADFISLHIPLLESTKNILNQAELEAMKPGVVLLNFSREGLIHHQALRHALQAEKLHAYVTDFPSKDLKDCPNVITFPHLGASTREAEENCAKIAVNSIKQFLEYGTISSSVNFPMVEAPHNHSAARLTIINANIPNMVARISSILGMAGLNIDRLINCSRENIAYTVMDIHNDVNDDTVNEISRIQGVIQVRKLEFNSGIYGLS